MTPHLEPDTPRLAGNCDLDVDECDSSPCQNGATCTESSVESTVSFHAYQCTCVAGFANGVCEYDGDVRDREDPPYGFIVEYASECDVQESNGDSWGWLDDTSSGADTPRLAGNCDLMWMSATAVRVRTAPHALSRVWSRLCRSMRTSAHVWLASRTVCVSMRLVRSRWRHICSMLPI